ncbi:hypothetical protein KP22_16095 [Pectobacterium betavasculorum]|uniref:Thioesterase domain-containing protein n=1 Tax=Pectobacterium betavasculorum TaxID=55207 RepID=A0A093RKC7_9GAMM|nr:alpha/beta fold hydrolase [Pectobacterium betavasculorum]KFX03245.1 hypothetical protein KP22_16095 [Pectobacterium betavasculorum]KFX18280.1 hypothetical protein JV35_16695 [Pectobacterium betavasculorum]
MGNRWLISPDKQVDRCKAAVILFHHAGGAASAYAGFRHLLPPDIRLWLVQLPGRESHRQGNLCCDGNEAARQILVAIEHEADARLPLVFYGHSMGAALAMQTAALAQHTLNITRVCLSSRRPPHLTAFEQDLLLATDQQVLEAVMQYGAVPEMILSDLEMRQSLIDKVRNDYGVARSLHCTRPELLLREVALSVWGGNNDPGVSLLHLCQWSGYSRGAFDCVLFPGDHFFLFDAQNKSLIARKLVQDFI